MFSKRSLFIWLENNFNNITNDILDLRVGGLNKYFLKHFIKPFKIPRKLILLGIYSNSVDVKSKKSPQNIYGLHLKYFESTTRLVSILLNPFQLLRSWSTVYYFVASEIPGIILEGHFCTVYIL